MQSGSTKITLKIKRDPTTVIGSTPPVPTAVSGSTPPDPSAVNGSTPPVPTAVSGSTLPDPSAVNGSTPPDLLDNSTQALVDLSSSDAEEDYSVEDEETQNTDDAQKQIVIYNPSANGEGQTEPVPDLNDFQLVPVPRKSVPFHSSKTLPSVGAFTVQCAKCFKWRLIPTKEKYEEIREFILEKPFFCDTAREWRPDITCEDEPDLSQDGSRLWAIDKPNIAQPPPGWQRLLRIRGEGSTKFADVYYAAPSGKRLRSMVEVQKYLQEHPEYVEAGVQLSQFSFQIPRPLQEDYVRKRPKLPPPDANNSGMPKLLEHSNANPISWAGPDGNTDLRLGGPGLSTPFSGSPSSEPVIRPHKKKAKKISSESLISNLVNNNHQNVNVEEPSYHQSLNGFEL